MIFRYIIVAGLVTLFLQCEISETCASCVDPDFTAFQFDTTAIGFTPGEIDSFYVIQFARGALDTPLDTTELFIRQNPFVISGDFFGVSSLSSDYVVEGVNGEFRFEVTDIEYNIRIRNDNCRCDAVENKSLRVNGDLISLPDPFQLVTLQP